MTFGSSDQEVFLQICGPGRQEASPQTQMECMAFQASFRKQTLLEADGIQCFGQTMMGTSGCGEDGAMMLALEVVCISLFELKKMCSYPAF